MADNVDVSADAEYKVSTDDAGASGHVQRVKLALSADGSAEHATVDADGVLVNLGANNDVTVTGDVAVTGPLTDGQLRAAAVPVSAASLPLPSGAATSANQATIAGHVDGIEALLTAIDTDTGAIASDAAAIEALLTTIDADTGSLPGIATSVDGVEALLTTIDADTSALAGAVDGGEVQVDVVSMPAISLGDTTTGWAPYTAAIASALTTELNALANGSITAASSAIDNTTAGDTRIDVTVTLDTQGSARSAGATVTVYIAYALDGTNYDRISASTAEPLVTLPYDAAVTATQSTRTGVIRPGLFKLFVLNSTGQALAATGNLVEYRTYKLSNAG